MNSAVESSSVADHQPHPKKKFKSMTSNEESKRSSTSLIELLHDDALRAILLRTNASDHDHLRQTCKRICRSINSEQFRCERSESGWAEVRCKIPTPMEQYRESFRKDAAVDGRSLSSQDTAFLESYDHLGLLDERYGYNRLKASVFVDEKLIKATLSIVVLPRHHRRRLFYGMWDKIEPRLSVDLFTKNGQPRHACLKQALASSPLSDEPFLYIQDLELPTEYRKLESTITPKVVLSLLLNTSLEDEWSIALYIPWWKSQYTEEDKRFEDESRKVEGMEFRGETPSDELILQKQAWKDRLKALTLQDMRQFFRVGFHQVTDEALVSKASYYYLFATPDDVRKELLSVSEALDVTVASAPPEPKERLGRERELYDLMKFACWKREKLSKDVREWEGPPGLNPKLRDLFMIRDRMDDSTKREMIDGAIPDLVSMKTSKAKQALHDTDAEVRKKVALIVEKAGSPDIIINSDAIHACASILEPAYIEMLMDFFPEEKCKRKRVLNHLDSCGQTALMNAFRRVPRSIHVSVDRLYKTCEVLVNLGIDKNIVNAAGLTALGSFRDVLKKANSFYSVDLGFGYPLKKGGRDAVARFELLLMPVNGPTQADDALLQGDKESDDDDDDESW